MPHHDYLTEIDSSDDYDCKMCRKFGDRLRTPKTKSELLCDDILHLLDLLVSGPSNPVHFVITEKTRGVIAKKKMPFTKLKNDLPKRYMHCTGVKGR